MGQLWGPPEGGQVSLRTKQTLLPGSGSRFECLLGAPKESPEVLVNKAGSPPYHSNPMGQGGGGEGA